MFCPKCGKEMPDAAGFCPACGNPVGATDAESAPVEEHTRESLPKDSGAVAASNHTAKKKVPKLPIILAIVVLAIAGVFALNHFKVIDLGSMLPFLGEQSQEQGGASAPSDPSSESPQQDNGGQSSGTSGDTGSTSSSGASQDTATTNPKDDIALSSIKLEVDSGGRYVISGKVTNNGAMELTPEIALKAIKHDTDKYGEEVTEETTTFGLISASSNISCDGNTITALQLQPKETRKFTAYPERWDSTDISYSDVEASVEQVTLPASVLNRYGHLLDVNKSFEVSDLAYSASGVVTGSITNNTGAYVSRAVVCFVMLDAQGNTIPSKRNTTRPSGVLLYSIEVDTLKPGDTAQFEKKVGEGYSSAKFLDVAYLPDESKNNVSN